MNRYDKSLVIVPSTAAWCSTDSPVTQDAASSTQSISTTILDYRKENGRTYHKYKDGSELIISFVLSGWLFSDLYIKNTSCRTMTPRTRGLVCNAPSRPISMTIPNPTDLQNHIFLLTFSNKLGLAPPNNADSKVKRALDLGTGTGIWALDFADEHPEAEVNSDPAELSNIADAYRSSASISPPFNLHCTFPCGAFALAAN